jgi:hypothetical protein
MLLNMRQLMDDANCYEVVRELRWPDSDQNYSTGHDRFYR